MNKKKTKLITTIVASALGLSATLGGALVGNGALTFADTTPTTYLAGDVFTGKNSTVDVSGDMVKF